MVSALKPASRAAASPIPPRHRCRLRTVPWSDTAPGRCGAPAPFRGRRQRSEKSSSGRRLQNAPQQRQHLMLAWMTAPSISSRCSNRMPKSSIHLQGSSLLTARAEGKGRSRIGVAQHLPARLKLCSKQSRAAKAASDPCRPPWRKACCDAILHLCAQPLQPHCHPAARAAGPSGMSRAPKKFS